jgi:hypothetical protein
MNLNYDATTIKTQGAICHCRFCKRDMFYSLELGINIVAIHITQDDADNVLGYSVAHSCRLNELRNKFKGMQSHKLSDGSYLFISIWCPYCDRIQNKDVYVPKWKVINVNNNIH